jgi:hypothetical protein
MIKKNQFITIPLCILIILFITNMFIPSPIVYTNIISGNNELVWLEKINDYQSKYCEYVKNNKSYLLSSDYDNKLESKSKELNSLYQYFPCDGKSLNDTSACDFVSINGVKTKIVPFKRFNSLTSDCYKVHKIL